LVVSRHDCDIVTVKPTAEKRDIELVQEKAKRLVWATGCTSWFIDGNTKRNTIMFPDWQYKFWLRSIFVAWDDFAYRTSATFRKGNKKTSMKKTIYLGTIVGGIVGIGALYSHREGIPTYIETAKDFAESLVRLKLN
jgi:hypothetical protein